ncbi:MAG: thiol reductant ABC exporter subunit CydD [Chloroflexi bacterium]|nr:thiol reductant ABC exporter subunit CydD [Chloroflexota bacterium]
MFSRRLLALARSSGLALTLSILLGWIGGLLIILQAWTLASIVNNVFLNGLTRAALTVPLGILLAVVAAKALTIWGAEVSANVVAQRVKTDLRERLLAHLADLGPAFTQGERTGELAAAAIEGVEALDAYFSQYLPQMVLAASIPLTVLLLIFPIDLLTGIIFLLTAPLVPFFMVMIGKSAETLTGRQFATLSRLSAHFYDVLQGLTTLKALGQAKGQAKVIADVSERYRDVTMQVLRVTFLSALALELLTTLSTAIVAVEIGLRLLYSKMEFLPAFFILVLAPDFYLPLRQLGLRFHAGMSGATAAKRIFEILDTPVQKVENGELGIGKTALFTIHKFQINFENVTYQYPNRDVPAIDQATFSIPDGQLTALVGASGAGKSTLASLLLRFIEPVSGRILVDDRRLDEIPAEIWRQSLAWVPQNPYLFQDSLSANLKLARPEAVESDLIRACEQAGLMDFIATLPQGFETVIGERGARLSGGQAQRLALARAFLKDAPFLLLDEPTSSLDPGLEAELQQSVQRLMKGRTALVIAHRLSTVFQADQIIVLEAGKIVETGKHGGLISQNGLYASLVKSEK